MCTVSVTVTCQCRFYSSAVDQKLVTFPLTSKPKSNKNLGSFCFNDLGFEEIAGSPRLPALHGGLTGGWAVPELPRFLGLGWLGLLAAVRLNPGEPGGPSGLWGGTG